MVEGVVAGERISQFLSEGAAVDYVQKATGSAVSVEIHSGAFRCAKHANHDGL